MQKTIVNISSDSYLNLHNIYDVVYEMGVGNFKVIELINTIERMFPNFSELEKMDLGIKVIKVLKALN
jgi:hypothetical protein